MAADSSLPSLNDATVLRALEEIEANAALTQRALSSALGISLGHANHLLRMLAASGLVSAESVRGNRFRYSLTARGVEQRSRGVLAWTRVHHRMLSGAQASMRERLRRELDASERKIAVLGADALFPIVLLGAADLGVAIAGIIDPARAGELLCGVSVVEGAGDPRFADVHTALGLTPGIPWPGHVIDLHTDDATPA